MITLRKLASLKEGTRLRKIARILRAFVETLASKERVDPAYLAGIGEFLINAPSLPASLIEEARSLLAFSTVYSSEELQRTCDNLHYHLLAHLGIAPGDWDLSPLGRPRTATKDAPTLPISVYLEDLRSPFNVGSIFRTADCFGVREIILSPGSPTPENARARRSGMGSTDVVPWHVASIDELEGTEGLFFLELGGISIWDFPFPDSGVVVVGSEELGLSPGAIAMSRKGLGVCSIPMLGSKGSLNVSVAFGILMSVWSNKLAAVTPTGEPHIDGGIVPGQ